MKNKLIIAAFVMLGVFALACAAGGNPDPQPAPHPFPAEHETQVSSVPDTGDKPQPSYPLHEFGDGTWQVNSEIVPGTYQTTSADGCYWARLSGFSGDFDDIIANDFTFDERVITEIKKSDTGFEASGCGIWKLLD